VKGPALPPAGRIHDLFLEPKLTYDVPEAAKLLGMTRKKLRDWIDAGEIEPLETVGGLVLPWAELVSFAMDFWDQAEVESALGADLTDAIPELLRLAELEGVGPAAGSRRARARRGAGRNIARCGSRPGVARFRLRSFRLVVGGGPRVCRGAGVAGIAGSDGAMWPRRFRIACAVA
jgi:excisionase family DNA binding protein